MTSSDGFCSPPFWQTPDTSTVPSRRASVPPGNEKTGQSQTGAPQVDKRGSWIQVPAETCSDEQSIIYSRPVTSPPHAYRQLTEAVLSQTQNCQPDSQLDVSGSPSSQQRNLTPYTTSSNNSPVELQDGLASERVPRTHDANKTFSLYPVQVGGLMPQPFLGSGQFTTTSETLAGHGSMEEHGESVLFLHERGTDRESVQPVPKVDFSDTVEGNDQESQSTSAGAVQNERMHSTNETFSLDPVIVARLSAQSPQGSINVTETSEALVAQGCVGKLFGELVQPDVVSAVDLVEENCQNPQSTSAAECPSKVTMQNVFSQLTGADSFDTHTTSALGVCGSPSPSTEYNSGPICSDYALVHLQDGITSKTAHITHPADMTLGPDPVMAGDIRVASETLSGAACAEEHGESAVLISDDKVIAVDSVEENCCRDCLVTSADAVQDDCQRQTLSNLSPSTLEKEFKQLPALSNKTNSNEACPGNESLAKCVTHTDFLVAADATDASAKKRQSWTGCCDMQLQTNHKHSQTTASESAGLPYSLRRRRQGGLTSSSAHSSFVPVSAKRSCPGLVQSCSSSSSPVEGCSQDAPSPPTVPVKKKRGRPRKIQQPVHLNEVSSTASGPAGKPDSKSTVFESTVTEDCLKETPDTSLLTRRRPKRKAAASAVSGKSEGQGNNDSPLDPPVTLSADAKQSQELSQEPELLVAPCSDLSFEQILQDDPMPLTPLSLPEEEEEEDEDPEEDEELPCILERKPLSITEGLCVWCKFRKYPFWPAVVKSVNHKNKKASIVFIDTFLIDEKGIRKGLTVSLKTLKPLDCEDAEELTEQARQQYGDAITWCLELIYDYRIRIGCGSFSGSFIEYFASDISCPFRQKYSQGTSDLTFPTQLIVDDLCDSSEEDGVGEQVDGHQCKKLLPDRAKAARTRANEKLVDFIVRKRGAEKRLLAVISGQETSKWLRAFQKASRFVVDPYLEDEEQVDQVYRYLDELLRKSLQTLPCLANLERIPFILDVLLPEALICAIAGVDDISLEQAEEKYRKGPCISKRERQEFNMRIEQLMKTLNQCKQVL